MSDKTGIEWTDATWNPIRGCSRVSPGCEHCYAERVAARFSGPGQPYEGLATMHHRKARWTGGDPIGVALDRGEPRWTGTVRLVPEHLADPLRWKRPRRIFVNSMSDLFHEKLSNEDIAAVFGVMAASPRHTFQVLTKRAARMREWFRWLDEPRPDSNGDPVHWYPFGIECAKYGIGTNEEMRQTIASHPRRGLPDRRWPLPNVWLGVSVENQRYADERIPLLLSTPASVRFISAEPLLGPIDLRVDLAIPSPEATAEELEDDNYNRRALDWVIAGAESGPGARPMNEDWVRAIRDQCAAAGVAFFYKQDARNGRKVHLPVLDGRQHLEYPR